MKQIIKIIFRVLALPFYIALLTIILVRYLGTFAYRFMVYGGETITYTKDLNPLTIEKSIKQLIKEQ